IVAAVRAQCVATQLPTGEDVWVPSAVMAAAVEVQTGLARIRDGANVQGRGLDNLDVDGLTPGQVLVAESIAGGMPVVVEGAAGTGKTHALRRALAARNSAGLTTIAVAPSRTAVDQLGEGWSLADTIHGLLVRADWTLEDNVWTPPAVRAGDDSLRGALIVVDEAGMVDLHTLAALTTHAEDSGARVALVGDDRQLSPVGVGGGFALAKDGSDVVQLTETRRFEDSQYAAIANEWRSEVDVIAVADAVMASGIVRIHERVDEAHAELAEVAAGSKRNLVMVADNATAVTVNRLVRAEHQAAGRVGPGVDGVGRHGEVIGVGDLIQTRLNMRRAGLVNRQRWVVEEIREDHSMIVRRADQAAGSPQAIRKELGPEYVSANVHRADAVTVHAAQGATSDEGHALLDSTWTREQAYVALTRGRKANVLHVVAEDAEDARAVIVNVLRSSERDRAAALVVVSKERHQVARTELTPGIAVRMRIATRTGLERIGKWATGSTLTAPRPVAPPVIDAKPPEAPSI
ncbi:MAG: ATP-dependent DNA helicase, partial [Lacisediminihabitans sp.]